MLENVPQLLKVFVCCYVTALKNTPLPLKINVTICNKIVDPLPPLAVT